MSDRAAPPPTEVSNDASPQAPKGLRAVWHRPGFRSAVRLGTFALYSLVVVWGGFFEWPGTLETLLWTLAWILWVVLLVMLVRELRGVDHKVRYVLGHLSIPLLLIAPFFMWFTWLPILSIVLVLVAYVMELRYHSAGDGFLFSLGLVVFVGIIAGFSMVEIENDAPESTLRTLSDGIFWAFTSLLRINYGKAVSPVTEDGRDLAVVVGICAVLGASLFTAQVVSWVVGAKDKDQQESDDDATVEAIASDAQPDVQSQLEEIRAEIAALRVLLEGQSSRPTTPESRD